MDHESILINELMLHERVYKLAADGNNCQRLTASPI